MRCWLGFHKWAFRPNPEYEWVDVGDGPMRFQHCEREGCYRVRLRRVPRLPEPSIWEEVGESSHDPVTFALVISPLGPGEPIPKQWGVVTKFRGDEER